MAKEQKCDATIEFGDDYGDNSTTFHCELKKGHRGKHKETGRQYGWKQDRELPYILEWGEENAKKPK